MLDLHSLAGRYGATTARIDNPPLITRSSLKGLERRVLHCDIHPQDSLQIGMR
jgi:hypothetical protein